MPLISEVGDVTTIENALCLFVQEELLEEEVSVTPETSFESLALDSIFLMELFLECERLSGTRIDSALLASGKATSIRALLDALK